MDLPGRHAAPADCTSGSSRPLPKASSCRRGRPTAVDRLRHVDDDGRPHQAGGRRAAGSAETLTRIEGYYLDPAYTPDGARVVFLAGRGVRSALLDPARHAARGRTRTATTAPREIGGVNPPNTLEIRWMPAAGGAATLVASAQGGRGPHFARNDSTRVYLTTNRGLQSITMDGYDRRTLLRVTGLGPGQQPARRRRDPAVARRHARVRQPAGQALPRDGAAGRPRDRRGAHPGPRATTPPCR